ncbi:MAG: winged helix-turn-helix domain-containing protein [Planctomycetes bacterium]|nr:winged helix-turn-helix domain-containing protein [Planctomycetota bacterium]NUQ35380.1 hypothetical protein [Planctomycetaceae bacterium]
MAQPNSKGPQFIRFMLPLLRSLREMGGAAPASDATDDVVLREKIPDTELAETLKNGESRIRNQIAWARMYLVKAGYMDW